MMCRIFKYNKYNKYNNINCISSIFNNINNVTNYTYYIFLFSTLRTGIQKYKSNFKKSMNNKIDCAIILQAMYNMQIIHSV